MYKIIALILCGSIFRIQAYFYRVTIITYKLLLLQTTVASNHFSDGQFDAFYGVETVSTP